MDKVRKILIEWITDGDDKWAFSMCWSKGQGDQISLKGICTEHIKKEKNRQKETDKENCLQCASKGFEQLANLERPLSHYKQRGEMMQEW